MSSENTNTITLEDIREVVREELKSARARGGAPVLLSMEEAADVLGVSRRTMDTLQAAGEVATLKIGRRRLVPADALCYYVDSCMPHPVKKKRRRFATRRKSLYSQLTMRDGGSCERCGHTPKEGRRLHIDHIKPLSRGGTNKLSNLQLLCQPCNNRKATKTIDYRGSAEANQ